MTGLKKSSEKILPWTSNQVRGLFRHARVGPENLRIKKSSLIDDKAATRCFIDATEAF